MLDLSGLNPRQREAVTHGDGPLLVLAGAGSGKTRVIAYRIAWLIGERGVAPYNILAVTFTNKAASEMLGRVERLVPNIGARPWIGTFHSTSLRMLRRYADRLGYTKSFVVYDTADQLTLVKRCMRELQMNDEAFPPRSILTRISGAKNELIGPAEYEKENLDFFGARVAEVYRMYQRRLKEYDAMDFDDLIGNYVRLLEQHEDVRDEIHGRFHHILIDEYQDTNRAQYLLIKALAGPRRNIVAVGDEDQSIYRFRGADINNILNFERDFPGAEIVKLEQNYRSTGNILDAATGVVENNVARKGKKLFTTGGSGEPVRIVTTSTDRGEAARRVALDRDRAGARAAAVARGEGGARVPRDRRRPAPRRRPSAAGALRLSPAAHRLPAHAAGVARHPGRVAAAEHRGAPQLRARVLGRKCRRAARRLSRLDYADVGPRPLRVAEGRDADDAARGEGARVQGRVPGRDGGGHPAALAVARGARRCGGGAPALLRRHDPRARAAVLHPLARADAARALSRAVAVAVPQRDSRGGARRGAAGPRAARTDDAESGGTAAALQRYDLLVLRQARPIRSLGDQDGARGAAEGAAQARPARPPRAVRRRHDPDDGGRRPRREADGLLRPRRIEEVHRQVREADPHLALRHPESAKRDEGSPNGSAVAV